MRQIINILNVSVLLMIAVSVCRADKVDDLIRSTMKENRIPGLSIAIIRNGKVIKAKGYGLANIELEVAATPDTIYRIGSTGKVFIASAIMILVEEGKVGLEDQIGKFLPDAPESWQTLTVRQLLSHTSGMPPEAPGFDSFRIQKDEDVIRTAYPVPLLFKPGEKAAYSNLGYFILAHIITRVCGKPWDEFLAERILKPLSMTATRTTSMSDIITNRASGYSLNGEKLENVSVPIALRPSGPLMSTVLDLAKFDAALYTEVLLKHSSLEQMWLPGKETDTGEGVVKGSSFGLGWVVSVVNGHRVVSKGGSNPGFKTIIVRFIDDHLSIVIALNADVRPGIFAYEIANFYIRGLNFKADQPRRESR